MSEVFLLGQTLHIDLIQALASHQTSTQQHALAGEIARPHTHGHHIGHFLRRAQPPDRNIAHVARRALNSLLIRDQPRVPNHGRRNIVNRDTLARVFASQVAHHALQPRLGRRIVAPVDAAPVRRQAADEDDAPPPLGLHVRDRELAQDEACAQVHRERVVELVDGDVQDVGDALAVPGVGHEHVRAVLPVLGLDFGEEPLDVVGRSHVCLVRGDFGRGPLW